MKTSENSSHMCNIKKDLKETVNQVSTKVTCVLLTLAVFITSTQGVNASAYSLWDGQDILLKVNPEKSFYELAEISNASSLINTGFDSYIKENEDMIINNNFDNPNVPVVPSEGIMLPEEETVPEEPIEEEVEPVEPVFKFNKKGWTTEVLNVRELPNTECDTVGVLAQNTKVKYAKIESNKEWVAIEFKGNTAYLSKDYISNKPLSYVDAPSITKGVSGDKRKSYMDYKTITSRSSRQYKIQHSLGATTASNGVRQIRGRYLIALGSYYTHDVGRYVDLILNNGATIECIVGDAKKNIDTNSNNSVGNDGSVAEFIVETSALSKRTRQEGNCDFASKDWNSRLASIRIYEKNLFE